MDLRKDILNKYYIEVSRAEYEALSEDEWIKQWFCDTSGGYVASHVLKAVDDMTRSGIVAEVKGCRILAEMGKHVLRLPENIPNFLDDTFIDGKPYCELLKFKAGEKHPRGYPDAYFDGQTWDFKETFTDNIDTIRQLFKNGRKADNVIFVVSSYADVSIVNSAVGRECGRRKCNGTWRELPNVYYLLEKRLLEIWIK